MHTTTYYQTYMNWVCDIIFVFTVVAIISYVWYNQHPCTCIFANIGKYDYRKKFLSGTNFWVNIFSLFVFINFTKLSFQNVASVHILTKTIQEFLIHTTSPTSYIIKLLCLYLTLYALIGFKKATHYCFNLFYFIISEVHIFVYDIQSCQLHVFLWTMVSPVEG